MEILVLNCGSSSVKFQLIETSPELMEGDQDRLLAKGSVENIGAPETVVTYDVPGEDRVRFNKEISQQEQAVETVLSLIGDSARVDGVGHRIVHGGERFTQSVLIDETVVRQIEECSELAPLHNPHNLGGYYAARAQLLDRPHVAVFDTAFHQTIPKYGYLYGLPYEHYSRHKVRRYGFHGTSHRYVTLRFAQLHGAGIEDFKLITCHLGNGCSMTAVDRGRSVDTSMGFTPLEGLLMGTRSGDVDPAAVLYVAEKERLSFEEIGSLLNHRSGLYGLSGISNDMRMLVEESGKGSERARIAIDVFCYRAKKYLGAYVAVLNGVDAVIFTGGIGENAPSIRAGICDSLNALGLAIDPQKNEAAVGMEMDISAERSTIRVWVIPTNEELLIARETVRCISSGSDSR